MKKPLLVFLVLSFSFLTASAQSNVLYNYNGTIGENPHNSLTYLNGVLYGMADSGGVYNDACIFKIDTSGKGYKDIFDFNNINGGNPYGNLTVLNNKLYSMTSYGGTSGVGLIFRVD